MVSVHGSHHSSVVKVHFALPSQGAKVSIPNGAGNVKAIASMFPTSLATRRHRPEQQKTGAFDTGAERAHQLVAFVVVISAIRAPCVWFLTHLPFGSIIIRKGIANVKAILDQFQSNFTHDFLPFDISFIICTCRLPS
jgi:hypothetical protein